MVLTRDRSGPRVPLERNAAAKEADMDHVFGRTDATRFLLRTGASAFAIAWLCIDSAPATAQQRPELRNEKITFDYYEPRNQKLLPLYEKLQKRAVLERLSDFLAPVQWPKKLRLIM